MKLRSHLTQATKASRTVAELYMGILHAVLDELLTRDVSVMHRIQSRSPKEVYMLCRSYLTQADYSSWFMSDLDPYDQYEVSVPLEYAGTCLTQVHRQLTLKHCTILHRDFLDWRLNSLSCLFSPQTALQFCCH